MPRQEFREERISGSVVGIAKARKILPFSTLLFFLHPLGVCRGEGAILGLLENRELKERGGSDTQSSKDQKAGSAGARTFPRFLSPTGATKQKPTKGPKPKGFVTRK